MSEPVAWEALHVATVTAARIWRDKGESVEWLSEAMRGAIQAAVDEAYAEPKGERIEGLGVRRWDMGKLRDILDWCIEGGCQYGDTWDEARGKRCECAPCLAYRIIHEPGGDNDGE